MRILSSTTPHPTEFPFTKFLLFTSLSDCFLFLPAFNHQGYMDKVSYPHLQSMTMCRVPGAHLSNHVITSSSLDTVKQCISGCVNHPRCLSLNYIIYTRLCELNDAVFSDWMTYKIAQTDYDEGLDPEEYIHYTSQVECWEKVYVYTVAKTKTSFGPKIINYLIKCNYFPIKWLQDKQAQYFF